MPKAAQQGSVKRGFYVSRSRSRAIYEAGSIWAKDKAGRITAIKMGEITSIKRAHGFAVGFDPAIALKTLVPGWLFVNLHHLPLCGGSAFVASIA